MDDLRVGPDDEELGVAPPCGELRGLEPARFGQLREACRDRRRKELGASASVLVARASEVIQADEPDAERDRQPDEHDDERSEGNERPPSTYTRPEARRWCGWQRGDRLRGVR